MVFALREQGRTAAAIATEVGMSLTQVHRWLRAGLDGVLRSPMRAHGRCSGDDDCPLVESAPGPTYAYLLGQYLGDGAIVAVNRSERLEIATSDAYPAIRGETISSIRAVMPGHAVSLAQQDGCTMVRSYSCHWPCLLPQHGAGRKHLRPIALDSWQERLVLDEHPDCLVRGLIHSDGCRVINRVHRPSGTYEYVRYLFDNRSDDIHEIFAAACDRIGVHVSKSKPYTSSVARRASVDILEQVVGPKR
jgi:hypothetical protein